MEDKMSLKLKKYFSESLGSAIFLFFGVGISIFAYNSLGIIGIACGFSLAYLFCYYTVSRLSGCHLNPIFSFGAMLTKKISVKEF